MASPEVTILKNSLISDAYVHGASKHDLDCIYSWIDGYIHAMLYYMHINEADADELRKYNKRKHRLAGGSERVGVLY